MKEELISYKTAKLAKQKGCTITSIWYFDEDQDNKCSYGSGTGYGLGQFAKNRASYAISQSILMRWLRETKHVYIQIAIYSELGFESYSYALNRYETVNNKYVGEYNTYEECLEKALYDGLELC